MIDATPQRPLRIVQVMHSAGYGGIERHALELMQGLAALGHEVQAVGKAESWFADQVRALRLPLHTLQLGGLLDLGSVFGLRRLARQWNADVVHGHGVRSAHFAGLSALGLRRPLAVCTMHSTGAHKRTGLCRHVIAVSGAVERNLIAHGERPDRVTVIHNGMPVPDLAADRDRLRAELDLAPGDFALVNAGRFVADKRQALLLDMLDQLPPSVRLYLIGDSNTGYGRTVAERASDDPRVRLLGYRADVQRLLPAFDAYVSSSSREALGLSLVEASAASLPCVATAVGGVPEVVVDGETGLLTPADDAAALAAAVKRLIDDAAFAQRLGGAARERFLDRFTVDRMAQDTAALYQRLLATSG